MDQAVNMHFHDIMGKKVCSCSFILLKTRPSLRQLRGFTGGKPAGGMGPRVPGASARGCPGCRAGSPSQAVEPLPPRARGGRAGGRGGLASSEIAALPQAWCP